MTTFDDLVKLINSTKNRDLLENLLLGLTTPYERKVLTRRIDIVKRLLDGESQQSIAMDLKVGVSTVTRGASELNKGRFKVLK